MRKSPAPLALAMLLLAALSAPQFAADTPDLAFGILLDALYGSDAAIVEAHLSTGSLEMMNMALVLMRMQPERAAGDLSMLLQTPLSGSEIASWTVTDLISAFISSPGMRDKFPPRGAVEVSGFDVSGDSGTVFLSVRGYPQDIEIVMVLESDGWKLSESVVGRELL